MLVSRESTIMFLHAETLAQSRSATYSETGTAEHLFALIDLCELIERHKKFILNRAHPADAQRIEGSAMIPRSQTRNLVAALLTERDWPQPAHIRDQGIDRQDFGHLAERYARI
jgi:hypothetical protein